MDGGGEHEPTPDEELLTVDGCWEGVASGGMAMLQWVALCPCVHGQHKLDSVAWMKTKIGHEVEGRGAMGSLG